MAFDQVENIESNKVGFAQLHEGGDALERGPREISEMIANNQSQIEHVMRGLTDRLTNLHPAVQEMLINGFTPKQLANAADYPAYAACMKACKTA